MGSHEPGRSTSLLIDRVLSAPGMLCVLHAPAGFGKSALLDRIRRRLSEDGIPHAAQVGDVPSETPCPWLLLDDPETRGLSGDALRQLLDRAMLSQAGVVVAVRDMDSLPVARLRAEGRVLRFGPQQIGMSRRESAAMLRAALPRKTADWLIERTDGWPVAISMLADHAHGADARFDEDGDFLTGSGLAAYIDQEVLAGLPDGWVEALLYASVVEGCDRAMLDVIRPDDDLGRHLSPLRAALPGLVDDRDGLTVLHPLLRMHLARRFEQLPREVRGDALERAAERCSRAGRAAEAASLVTRVGRPDAIVDFVRRSGGLRLWVTAGFDVIREIVAQAGSRGIEDEPRLKLLKCLVHMKAGEIVEGERLFAETEAQLGDDKDAQRDAEIVRTTLIIYGCRTPQDSDLTGFSRYLLRNNDDPAWRAIILMMQCILRIQNGDLDDAVADIVEATKQSRAARTHYGELFLLIHSTNVALARGDLQRARGTLGEARRTWRENFPTDVGVQTIIDALTASLEFEAGRLSSARLHIRRSTHHMPHVEAWLDIYAAAYEPMARLLVPDIGLASTLTSLETQRGALTASGLPRIAHMVKALELCLRGEAALRGETAWTIEALRHDQPNVSPSWQERELAAMAAAYAGLASGQLDAARDALAALIRFAEPRGLVRSLLRAKLLLVAVLDRRGDGPAADACFDEALAIGARTGMSRAFAEIGGGAVGRRWRARLAQPTDSFADPRLAGLLRSLARWDRALPKSAARLTPRENDVLGALDQGGGDKAIGRRLGITEHAVRYHLKNIYRKLGASDRVGALAQARETGLLG